VTGVSSGGKSKKFPHPLPPWHRRSSLPAGRPSESCFLLPPWDDPGKIQWFFSPGQFVFWSLFPRPNVFSSRVGPPPPPSRFPNLYPIPFNPITKRPSRLVTSHWAEELSLATIPLFLFSLFSRFLFLFRVGQTPRAKGLSR